MQGISITELCESIIYSHEVEFIYDGVTYILQPIATNEKAWLIIDCVDTSISICATQKARNGD